MTPSKPPMGINVASDTKAGLRFADMIVDGHKTLESRNSDTLRPYVGKRVAIVRTGEGKAKAIGEVTIGEPKVVNQKQFRAMEEEHKVSKGSRFDINTPTKHLYPMHDPVRYEKERDVGHGIVSRQVIYKTRGGAVEPTVNQMRQALAAKGGKVEVRPTVKDETIQRKIPQMESAAKKVSEGKMSHEAYDKVVNKHKPVKPYEFVPQPASDEDADRALMENKKPHWRGAENWPAGRKVGLRLDIPAYETHGVWVNSIHDEEGKGEDKRKTSYGPVSSVKNATFDAGPSKAIKVATGEDNKSPFARIKGDLHHMTEDEAVEHIKKNLNHPDYAQVGMDPRRHGFFYDRKTLKPVTHAKHVVQIGPLVLAHKPTYGERESYARGGIIHKAQGGTVKKPFDYENPSHVENVANIAAKHRDFNKIPDVAKHLAQFISQGSYKSIEDPRIQMAIRQAGHDGYHVNVKDNKQIIRKAGGGGVGKRTYSSKDFLGVTKANNASSSQQTQAGLKALYDAGYSPDEAASLWNESYGTNFTGADYIRELNNAGIERSGKPRLAVFGDSISSAVGYKPDGKGYGDVDTTYGQNLAQVLGNNLKINTANNTRGGATSQESVRGAAGQPFDYGNFAKYITENKPSSALLRFGAADAILMDDPATSLKNIENMVQISQQNGTKPILVGVTPFAKSGDINSGGIADKYVTDKMISNANAINAGIKELSKKYNAQFVDVRNVPVPPGGLLDGVHPSGEYGLAMDQYISDQIKDDPVLSSSADDKSIAQMKAEMMNQNSVTMRPYDYKAPQNQETRSIPGAGDEIILFWDHPNKRVVVSDEGYWNPTSPTGDKLKIAVDWAHNQGYQAGVVLVPYASDRFSNELRTGVMANPAKPATDDELRAYIDAADFVVADPYLIDKNSATPEMQDNFSSFAKNVGDYANSKGKDTWLVLQGFANNGVDRKTVQAFNDRLTNENANRYQNLSFYEPENLQNDKTNVERPDLEKTFQLAQHNYDQKFIGNPYYSTLYNPLFDKIDPSTFTGTAQDKANRYNEYLKGGASDFQIRQAVELAGGAQSNADWTYLQNLASTPVAPAPTAQIASPLTTANLPPVTTDTTTALGSSPPADTSNAVVAPLNSLDTTTPPVAPVIAPLTATNTTPAAPPEVPPVAPTTAAAPDYSRAYAALGGADAVNALRDQFLKSGLDENTIGSVFSKYYAPDQTTAAATPNTQTSTNSIMKDGGVVRKAMGGSIGPSINQMRSELMNNNRFKGLSQLQSIGAEEAPSMGIKAYVPTVGRPDNGEMPVGGIDTSKGDLPIGGIDMSQQQVGQQLMPTPPMPSAPPAGQQQGMNQVPMGDKPPMGGAPQMGGMPPPQGGSNILSMTPQGQAMAAIKPPGQPMPGMKPQGLAKGGQPSVDQMKAELASKNDVSQEKRVTVPASGAGGVKGIVVPKHLIEGNPKAGAEGLKNMMDARAKVYGEEHREPLNLGQMGKIHKQTLEEHFAKPLAEQKNAEQEALNKIRSAKFIKHNKDTLDESEKLDTVEHEHDEQGRSHVGYASKGIAGHALFPKGHGDDMDYKVINTCPGQTEGCGGGKSAEGIVDTKQGTCFAPNAESQYAAAVSRRAGHAIAKHDPAMTRDWIIAHTGSMRNAANRADKQNKRMLYRPNVVDETDVSSRHVIRHLNDQRKMDDKPPVIANSYGKTNELHDPENGYHVTHSNVGPKVKKGQEISENVARDKARVRNTVMAADNQGDFKNEQGNKTPPKGSYMVTDVKRGSPMAKKMEGAITHAKYWTTGRPEGELSHEEREEGPEGHYSGTGRKTSEDQAHYGHTTHEGLRYDYQKQHVLHPRLVQVGKNDDGTPHIIPTDSRFKDEEFLPKNRFKTKNGKNAGHILMTTPTESTSNIGHQTSFTHNVSDKHIEHAEKNNGEYEIDKPEDQAKAKGKEYAAPQTIQFKPKPKAYAMGGSVGGRHIGFSDDDFHAFPEQNVIAQRHLAMRGDDHEAVAKHNMLDYKRKVTINKDLDTMLLELTRNKKAK